MKPTNVAAWKMLEVAKRDEKANIAAKDCVAHWEEHRIDLLNPNTTNTANQELPCSVTLWNLTFCNCSKTLDTILAPIWLMVLFFFKRLQNEMGKQTLLRTEKNIESTYSTQTPPPLQTRNSPVASHYGTWYLTLFKNIHNAQLVWAYQLIFFCHWVFLIKRYFDIQ